MRLCGEKQFISFLKNYVKSDDKCCRSEHGFSQRERKGVHMKRKAKPYSIEEDYAQDAHELRHTAGYPSETGNIQPIGYRSLLIEKLEEYDPGGKRAHEIAGKFRD